MHRKSQVSNRPSPLPHISFGRLPDDTVEAVLEPLHGLSLVDLVAGTDGGLRAAALGNTLTRAGPGKDKLSVVFALASLTRRKEGTLLVPFWSTHMQQKKSMP